MQELLYVLRVSEEHGLQEELQELLVCASRPQYVRLSTMAPLSNFGYPEGAEGSILAVSDAGLVVGAHNDGSVPHSFVPWQNISYIAESHGLENAADEVAVEPAES